MNPVPMQCPLCAGMIQIDPAYAGQQVGCPLCQGVMLLPPPEFFGLPTGFPAGYSAEQPPGYPPPGFAPPGFPPQYPQEAPPSLPQLGCPVCGGAFQVSPEMAGHQVACPHCQNAVSIPDLFGGVPAPGYPPPPVGPTQYDMPQHSMQFIGMPPGAPSGPEIPTGYAVPSMPPPTYEAPPEFGPIPGIPVGMAVAPAPQPADDRFPPQRPREQPSPPQPAASSERRGDANLYPPGMQPKDVATKKEKPADRAEQPERPRDGRFPPGMERRETKEREPSTREKPVTEREQRYPPGFKPPQESHPATEVAPKVEDLLPPGAVAGTLPPAVDSLLPPGAALASAVDALLPPGAVGGDASHSESDAAVSRHTVVDTLLPPGAPSDPAAVPPEHVALPDAPPPARKPMPAAGPGRLVLPTPDGDYVTVENKEGVKTISDRGEEIEIRKLSPEERARRRRVKNIVMFTFAIIILAVVILLMSRK